MKPATSTELKPIASAALHLAGNTPQIWDDQQAAYYLKGIEQSDYAEKLGNTLLELVGKQAQLLDIGAGAGTVSRRILENNAQWTAIEPNAFLADYLTAHQSIWPFQLNVIQQSWQQTASDDLAVHDASLAANTSGPLSETRDFWHWQRQQTKRLMIWIVPAQSGPRGKCLSGFLPASLHGEVMGSPIHEILDALGDDCQPNQLVTVDWTFQQSFADFHSADSYFQQVFNPAADPEKASALTAYLTSKLQPDGDALLAKAAKKSAVLIWTFN
ncbi:hypothetical protein [Methylophaga lonarensis]